MSAVNFDLLSAKETLGMLYAPGLLLSERFELFGYLSVAKRVLPEWAAKMTPSWIVIMALPNLQ